MVYDLSAYGPESVTVPVTFIGTLVALAGHLFRLPSLFALLSIAHILLAPFWVSLAIVCAAALLFLVANFIFGFADLGQFRN